MKSLLIAAAALFALAACDGSGPTADAALDGAPDAALDAAPDSALSDGGIEGGVDSSVDDGGPDATDDAATDAGTDGGTGDGFGVIAGPCAMLTGQVVSASPSFFMNRLDFGDDPFDDPEDVPQLTSGAQEILAEGTAGGSSGLSEALAYDVLERCEGATLLKSETEIVYTDPMGKITDLLITLDGERVGVSVTRAFIFPPSDPFTVEIATERLVDKLGDVLLSSANVAPEDEWVKQILFIMAYADMHAQSLETAWMALDPAVTADTIVYVVTTDGMDEPLY